MDGSPLALLDRLPLQKGVVPIWQPYSWEPSN
jgi:hypothetical protein